MAQEQEGLRTKATGIYIPSLKTFSFQIQVLEINSSYLQTSGQFLPLD